ncbi:MULTISPECIES: PAAR-like domain-containing protein [Pseudomonas]|uniref:PAAR-like domain-containing protein n=1 Tax=Pseudomonas TaxID=286 RepID=UPI0007320580|nr:MULTISPECIES: PAAR-like domain-containing protein [Pseudomonas]QGA50128.1 DUF4150 domain-containing protein [Pseudomonas brassicacearum]
MANEVYANNMEVSCKSAAGKSIACFPDVCFTPPQAPPTPLGVPIPYPNTGMAKDTTRGTRTVKITGKEVMLKDKSCFKTSTGDEAGNAPKKGVVTSKIKGKVYFIAWSMDVKFEGENVVRHLDLMTHNHASKPGNTPPWAYADAAATTPIERCKKEVARKNKACGGLPTKAQRCDDKACTAAKKCLLVSKKQADSKAQNSQVACCPGETGHHLVEAHSFTATGSGRQTPLPQFPNYDEKDAPCICVQCPQDGSGRYEGDHGFMHAAQGKLEQAAIEGAPPGQKDYAWNYGQSRSAGVRALQQTFPKSKCSKKCLEAQLDAYHKNTVGVRDKTPVRTHTPNLQDNQKALAHDMIPEVTISAW